VKLPQVGIETSGAARAARTAVRPATIRATLNPHHERASAIGWTPRVTTALLLIGHGGFDFAMGKDWASYAAAVGVSPAAVAAHPLSPMAGCFECVLGLTVLAWPVRALLVSVFVWKLASEAFRPLAGEPIWSSSSAPAATARRSRSRGFKAGVRRPPKSPT
jgi:hypothetical protein